MAWQPTTIRRPDEAFWSAPAERSGDGALARPRRSRKPRPPPRPPNPKRRGAALPAALQNAGAIDFLECAGRAQRRRRFGSPQKVAQTPTSATSSQSKAAWRCASRRTPKRRRNRFLGVRRQSAAATALWLAPEGRANPDLRHVLPIQSGVALRFPPHSKTPAQSISWSAPAERSGDGALARPRRSRKLRPPPRPPNPKRRGAALPAALQNASAIDFLECAGRAQRRRRFGSPQKVAQTPTSATSSESKAAWRFASRRTPKRQRNRFLGVRRQSAAATALWLAPEGRANSDLRHVLRIQSGVALRFPPHSKTPAQSISWSAPAERSGDGALARPRRSRKLRPPPRPPNPKRRGAA